MGNEELFFNSKNNYLDLIKKKHIHYIYRSEFYFSWYLAIILIFKKYVVFNLIYAIANAQQIAEKLGYIVKIFIIWIILFVEMEFKRN